jgi:hypothetical protein
MLKLGVVVHACSPSFLGGGGRRITNSRAARARSQKQNKTGCQWLTPVIQATQKAEIRGLASALGKWFPTPYLKKISSRQRAFGVGRPHKA